MKVSSFADFKDFIGDVKTSVTVDGITVKVDGNCDTIDQIVNAGKFDIFQRDDHDTRVPVTGFKTRKLSGAAGRAAAKRILSPLLKGSSNESKTDNQ